MRLFDFVVALVMLFLFNFLPMVYGWGIAPSNPWWIMAGYFCTSFLYAAGNAAAREQREDKRKLLGEKE